MVKIRDHFQDDFFIKTIQIDEDHIDTYIFYCLKKGIGPLYDKGRLIEVIDVFLKNKDPYFASLTEVD